ncbi:Crp/Fnr family transcriptional regulator [Aquimarina rhabdastrellae]
MLNYFPLLFPDELIQKLTSKGYYKYYLPGDIILTGKQTPDLNFFLIDGLVKIYLEKIDKKFFISYQKGHDFCLLNSSSALSSYAENFSFKVIHPSKVLILSKRHVFDYCHHFPSFRKHIFDCYQREYLMIMDNLKNKLNTPLLNHLFNYLKMKSIFLNDHKIPYSILEISEDLQFSKKSISKGLSQLEQQKKIVRNINTITIL